jgi:uncharacterized membrane-anchored protein YhcB (DUF1043 family)
MMTGILLGVLIGLLAGTAVCVRYLRQELAANVGPKLRRIEQQLDTLQAEINLATTSGLTDLSRPRGRHPSLPGDTTS